jgi:hypothetical protein
MTTIDRMRGFLIGRAQSYRRTFNLESQDVQLVLEDLSRFCRAHTTTYTADARAHAVAEGRREVWLRIAHHMNLTNDDLWRLYAGVQTNQAKAE